MNKINDELNRYSEFKGSKELDDFKSQIVDEIYKSNYIREFLDAFKLDSSFVDSHIVELYDMANSVKACSSCQGYLKCPNVPKGYVQTFNVNKDIIEYDTCSKLKEIYPIKKNYTIRNFPEEWLYNNVDELLKNTYIRPLFSSLTPIITQSSKKGLYLYGPSGCGKSFIMVGLTNSLIKDFNYKVSFANFRDLLEELKSSFDYKDSYMKDTLTSLKDIDVLVIDDLGTEKVSEWSTYQVLFDILQERLRLHKLTLITSLYSLEELRRLYGGNNPKTDRLIDLIKMLCDERVLEGINYNNI